MDFERIPETVRRQIEGLPYTVNETGMSGSRVLVFPDRVLKIGKSHPREEGMIPLLRWLEGKLPAPRVLAFEEGSGLQYLLMSRVSGKMACDKSYLEQPELLLKLLADALRLLWAVDISDCPRSRSLDMELAFARENLETGACDFSNCEPDTFGPGGFAGPEALLRWLEDNKPSLELAFSHGDCCLPNIFFEADRVSGFIDLGDAGAADKWRDLALCCRSLKHNTNGAYGPVIPGFRPERLFDYLGIKPDWDKLRYYILLDEFY